MRDYLTIGSAPAGEDCVQVDSRADYSAAMRAECKRFQSLLTRAFPAPAGSSGRIAVKSFPHDFGPYLEVCAVYDDQDEAAAEWAFTIESDCPETWDDLERLADEVSPVADGVAAAPVPVWGKAAPKGWASI